MVLGIERSKVKVTGSATLHNDTSFQTTIAFHSHSLVGDTDKSNTAWSTGFIYTLAAR